MKEYQIIRKQYIDDQGREGTPYYVVKYKVPFLLFWGRWKWVKHEVCYMDCYSTITEFDTLAKAQVFVNKFICGGEIRDGFKKEIVEHKSCN